MLRENPTSLSILSAAGSMKNFSRMKFSNSAFLATFLLKRQENGSMSSASKSSQLTKACFLMDMNAMTWWRKGKSF